MSKTLMVTGHRPSKLYGYNYYVPHYKELEIKIKNKLLEIKPDICIAGGAIGVDTLFALSVLDYNRKIDPKIVLKIAVPCLEQDSQWNIYDKAIYRYLIHSADNVHYCSTEKYAPYLMQKRNEWMVDNSDLVLAVFDGEELGGTWNCIKYAMKQGKEIIYIQP